MNCSEANELLQERLDGLPGIHPQLEEHLAACGECRSLHAGAGQLLAGLRHMKAPTVSPGLAATVAAAVRQDRGQRLVFRRQLIAVSAVAAGLLLAVVTLFPYLNRPTGPVMVATPSTPTVVPAAAVQPSLRASFADAGSAFVALTRRTADDTVGQTRLLIPESVPASLPVPDMPDLTATSWNAPGVSTGLEPIATSARRAFSMLMRESPDEKR